jgi:hypothetical protein
MADEVVALLKEVVNDPAAFNPMQIIIFALQSLGKC